MNTEDNSKPILVEKFADNGAHSHWELIDGNGDTLWEEHETPYSKAWKLFKRSKQYHKGMTAMFEKGILNPYSQNILREAFDFAWNHSKD